MAAFRLATASLGWLSQLSGAVSSALRAPLDGFNMSDALLSAHLATAAYCGLQKHGGDAVLRSWSCGPPCDGVAGLKTAIPFHGSGGWGADGFIGDTGDKCVLSFRGSSTFTDWATDARSDYLVELTGLGIPCEVDGEPCMSGGGFTGAYLTVNDNVTALLEELGCKQKPLVVTGHSLGAAEAALAMLDLSNKGFQIATAYTFGQPRVGNAVLAAKMKTVADYFRFTYGKDPVVHLPPRNVSMRPNHEQPAHWPVEVYYTEDSDGALDYAICTDDDEQAECSNRYEQHAYPSPAFILRHKNDHLRYFANEMGFPMDGDACSIQVKKGHFAWSTAGTSFALGAVTASAAAAMFFFLWSRKPGQRMVRFRAGDVEDGPSSLGASLATVKNDACADEKPKDARSAALSTASTRYTAGPPRLGCQTDSLGEMSQESSRTGSQSTDR